MVESRNLPSYSTTPEIRFCPVQETPREMWVKCPDYEYVTKPSGAPSGPYNPLGCCAGSETPEFCLAETRQIVINPNTTGGLQELIPDFAKLPRQTNHSPLEFRGFVEEIDSRECLLFAYDTEETHLIRMFLQAVTPQNTPKFYWPVGFETEGYHPQLSLPVLTVIGGSHPEYQVRFSQMEFWVLVERNENVGYQDESGDSTP